LLAVNASVAHPSLVGLFVLSALSAGVAGYSNPARNAAIPRLVSEEHLVAAYSLNQTVIQISTIVGPIVAGAILARTSVAICFALDAVSFLALIVATVQMAPLAPLTATAHASVLQSIRNGFGYVRAHTIAQAVYLIDLNAMIFGSPRSLFRPLRTATYRRPVTRPSCSASWWPLPASGPSSAH
jgi:MFS family permease